MRTVRVGRRMMHTEVDKFYVVPYSPNLSKTFARYVSVELFVSRVGGIKNLVKS